MDDGADVGGKDRRFVCIKPIYEYGKPVDISTVQKFRTV